MKGKRTLARASRAASASAAMALCNCTGSRTSFLWKKFIVPACVHINNICNTYEYDLRHSCIALKAQTYISTRSTLIPHVSVASSKETWHSVLFQTFKQPCMCLRARVVCALTWFQIDSSLPACSQRSFRVRWESREAAWFPSCCEA